MAIRMACKKQKSHKLKNHSLYVTLEPCKMCEAANSSYRNKKGLLWSLFSKCQNF